MQKLSKILVAIVGFMFIFIGSLHLKVHYAELVSPELQEQLNIFIPLMGKAENVWKMWQGFSFMMGFCFIIIGLINLLVIKQLAKENYFPPSISIIMIFLFGGVIYSGLYFFGTMQIYGGMFGMTLQSTALVIALLQK